MDSHPIITFCISLGATLGFMLGIAAFKTNIPIEIVYGYSLGQVIYTLYLLWRINHE